MSLQVWLPLNGNLNNYGLSNVQITNSGTTVNNNGKIGKCYAFDGSQFIKLVSNDIQDIFQTPQSCFSMACWIYLNTDETDRVIIFGNYSANPFVNWELLADCTQRLAAGGTSNYTNKTNSYVIPKEKWTHIAVTYNGNLTTFYVNGILQGAYTGANTMTTKTASNTFWLGSDNRSGATRLKGRMNDFRLYDHCLSKKEIEEISKGLILHYKLDDKYSEPTINICNGSTNGTQASAASPSSWGAHKYYTILTNKDINDPIPNNKKSVMTIDYSTSYGSGGGASVYPPTSFTVEPSTTYIYSRYIKPSDDFVYTHANFLYRYEYASGGGTRLIEGGIFNKNNIEYIGNGWYRCWGTFTTQSTTAYLTLPFYTYPGKSITYELSGLQLEKKDHMTPYVERERTGIVYDSSGYNNNGELVGNVKPNINSIRYNCCTHFESGQYIIIKNYVQNYLPKDAITVNIWIKPSTWYNPISCTEGGGWNFENSSGVQFPVYISGVGYKIANSGVQTSTLLNSWHMLTGVFNGTEVKIYVDGVLKKTTATGSTNGIGYANNYLIISGEAQTTSPASSAYVGEESDIRIYATALTDEQILELYNTSATIDNNGNVYAREVIE